MVGREKGWRAAAVLLLAAGLWWWRGSGQAAARQDAGIWSPPQFLFETTGRASEPEIIVDNAGTVHVFWAYGNPENEADGTGQSLYYAQQQNGVWSDPTDILVSPGGRVARMPAVALDERGYLHLAWSGGNAIYYSRAYATEAGAPQGWAEPAAFTLYVAAYEPDVVAVGDDVYLLWTEASNGLVFARSADGGRHWTPPRTIFAAPGAQELARWGRLAVDGAGRLHVALSLVRDNDLAAPRADPIYMVYLRSENAGSTWTDPWLIAPEPDYGEVTVITHGANDVHLFWNGRAGTHGRYHRQSPDGGQTWSDVETVVAAGSPLGLGGLTGFPAVVVDARGDLHLVSTSNPQNFYTRWHNGTWSDPVVISDGVRGAGVTGASVNMEMPSLALGQGNQLYAVFHDGQERIWTTGYTLDLPAVPPHPLATVTPMPAATITTAPPPAPTNTPMPTFPPAAPAPLASPYASLLWGLASAGIFLTLALLIARARHIP